jgi:Zn-dependent peptidase ImmA (M78 family)
MAAKVLNDSKVTAPPVDLRAIAEANGIQYYEVEEFPDSVDALIIEDGRMVYAAVNARQHLHRQRFSLAHELGHFFLHRDFRYDDDVTIDNPPSEQNDIGSKDPAEAEADLFAGELLVPLSMLKLHVRKDVPELARIFSVSQQVMAIAVSRHVKALF